jgi:NAD(P)-dependent dehydrogenase (short-subunit alcohol dehydrogenase family)
MWGIPVGPSISREDDATMGLDSSYLRSAFVGQVAVVTGGSGVLCSAIAEALGQRGAKVVVVGHSHMDRAQHVADRIHALGGEAMAVQGDVLSKGSLAQVADRTIDAYGKVDILINGAGGNQREATTREGLSFFDLPEEAVRWVVDLNFLSALFACQVFGKIMVEQDRGSILNFSSMAALKPLTRTVAYSAGKAALTNFTQWLAVHMAQEYSANIRVNALMPGYFLTEQNRYLVMDGETGKPTERGQCIIDHTPMARFGTPEDLIGPALWLLSDAALFVHGIALVVDGGVSAFGGV